MCLLKTIFLLHSIRLAFDPLIPLSSLGGCWHQVFQLHYNQLKYSLLSSQALSKRSLILFGDHKFYNQPSLPLMSHTLQVHPHHSCHLPTTSQMQNVSLWPLQWTKNSMPPQPHPLELPLGTLQSSSASLFLTPSNTTVEIFNE